MSDSYIETNSQYWNEGYDAPNVESFVFRANSIVCGDSKVIKIYDIFCDGCKIPAKNIFNRIKLRL